MDRLYRAFAPDSDYKTRLDRDTTSEALARILAKPLALWTATDVNRAMMSRAYMDGGRADPLGARDRVTAWFKQTYPGKVDLSGGARAVGQAFAFPESRRELDETLARRAAGQLLQDHGRHGDTLLAHITEQEAMLLHLATDGGSINPMTGLLEFWEDRDDNDTLGGTSGQSAGASVSDTGDVAGNLHSGDDQAGDDWADGGQDPSAFDGFDTGNPDEDETGWNESWGGGGDDQPSIVSDRESWGRPHIGPPGIGDPDDHGLPGGDGRKSKDYTSVIGAKEEERQAISRRAEEKERDQKIQQLSTQLYQSKAYKESYKQSLRNQKEVVDQAKKAEGEASLKLGDASAQGLGVFLGQTLIGTVARGAAGRLGKGRDALKGIGDAALDAYMPDPTIKTLHEDLQKARDAHSTARQTYQALKEEADRHQSEVDRIQAEIDKLEQ
ncbi:protein of unknown function [Magnetospira sp. QH-2]|nr:protein of unknown function [Magnetospira sp. QH-2]